MAAETAVSVTLTGDEYQALMARVEKAERDAAEADAMNGQLAHENYHLEAASKALRKDNDRLRVALTSERELSRERVKALDKVLDIESPGSAGVKQP